MRFIKNNKKFFVLIIIFIILSIIAHIIDNKLSIVFSNQANEITKILLGSTVSFLGVWISCYFLAIQIYKNRYPMDLIKSDISTQFNKFMIMIILCFVMGIVYLYIKISLILSILYTLFCILCLLFISKKISETINDLSINTIFESKIKEIDSYINSNNIDERKIKEKFKNLSKLFNDSYNNSNYYMCEKITNELSLSFDNLISNSSRILLNETETQNDITDKVLNIYINFYKDKLMLTKDCSYNHLFFEIVKCQEDNIISTIKARQEELFEKYISEIITFTYILDESSDAYEILFEMIFSVSEYLIDKSDNLTYEEIIVKNIMNMIVTKNFQNKESGLNTKNYYRFIIPLLMKTMDKNKEEYYKFLINNMTENTQHLSIIGSSFEDSFVYFISYTNKLVNIGNVQKIKDYINIYAYIETPTSSDIRWVNYHLNFFDILFEKFEELESASSEIICVLLRNLIANKISFQNVLLPKYHLKKYYKKSKNANFEDFSENLYLIMRAAVMNENIYVLSFYFDEIKEYLFELQKSEKKIQKELIAFYITLFKSTADFSSKKITSFFFYEFNKVIRKIDAEHKLSSELEKYILSEIQNLAQYCIERSEFFVAKCINLLFEFLEENNETHFAIANQEFVIKCIYNIGLNCIENNQEYLLRQVSNAIGWITLNAIKKKNNSIFNYGISRAIDLYRLSKYMEITTKTKTFIMTLFTTIGAYCTTEPNLYPCRNKIISTIVKEDFDIVKTATDIRTKENNMWNSLMDDPQKRGKEFLDEFKKQQKSK